MFTLVGNRLARVLRIFVVLLASVTHVAAQDEWKLEGSPAQIEKVLSIQIADPIVSIHRSVPEKILLVRTKDSEGTITWNSFESPSLKKLSTISEPTDWNWSKTSFGSTYICSTTRELLTVDLRSGKQLKNVKLKSPGIPQILFDKAVWIDAGQLIAIPSLTDVQQHPLVNRASNLSDGHFKLTSAQRLDSEHWIINGLIYPSNLKPVAGYWSNYLIPPREVRESELQVGLNTIEGKTAISLLLKERVKANAPPTIKTEFNEPAKFLPCYHGYYGVVKDQLFLVVCSRDHFPPEMQPSVVPALFVPPLLSVDGKRHRIHWQDPSKACELRFQSNWPVSSEFANNEQEIWLTDKMASELENQAMMRAVAQLVEQRANVPASASWETVIASYKANSERWLAPYAAALKTRFSGIPVEIPCWVECILPEGAPKREVSMGSSIVIDFPEKALQAFRPPSQRLLELKDTLGDSTQSLQRLQAFLGSELAHELPDLTLPDPAPPDLPDIPPAINPQSVEGSFEWIVPSHRSQLSFVVLRIGLHAIAIAIALKILSLAGRAVELVGKPQITAVIVAATCVFLDLGFCFLVDLMTERMIADSPKDLLVRAMCKFMVYCLSSSLIYWVALVGQPVDRVVTWLCSILISAVLPAAILLYLALIA